MAQKNCQGAWIPSRELLARSSSSTGIIVAKRPRKSTATSTIGQDVMPLAWRMDGEVVAKDSSAVPVVFEPGDSVESIQAYRSRGAAEVVIAPTLARDSLAASRPRIAATSGLAPTRVVAPPGHPMVNWLPRATLAPAPPFEDPH